MYPNMEGFFGDLTTYQNLKAVAEILNQRCKRSKLKNRILNIKI